MIQIDMEMPKNCSECRLLRTFYPMAKEYCPIESDITYSEFDIADRPENCPLSEVE